MAMSQLFPSSFLQELAQNNSIFNFDIGQSLQNPPQSQPRSTGNPSNGKDCLEPSTKSRRKDAAQSHQRRNKYIPRACQDCQRRKVKCSGEEVCSHCRARSMPCVYLPRPDTDGRRKRPRVASPPHQSYEKGGTQPSPSHDESNPSLEDKVARLQEEVRKFAPQNVGPSNSSADGWRRLTFSSSALYTVDLVVENADDTDTFNNGTGSNNLSLSAQLADIQKLLKMSTGLRPKKTSGRNRVFPLELPHPSRLHYLLSVYFREMGSFFPILDPCETEGRLWQALESLGYSEYDLIIDVDSDHYPIIALLCNMLVLGECQDPEVKDCDDPRPGWSMYHRGRKLLQHCGSARTVDIDLIRYHTLSALYMMNSELLQSASHAITTAVQSAMVARLNDQALWGDCSADERKARQRLWWTIYFLDRRIAQRNGIPYLLRDREIAVDEFRLSRPTKTCQGIPIEQIEDAETHTENYLQSLIDFGKLWSHIWDTFYAALASKIGDLMEVALTDTRILVFRRQLPSELTWDTEKVSSYVADGESEPRMRRRLSIFIRINLLRMIIRQNPVLSCDADEEARHFCAALARTSIDAIAAFAGACPRIRSSGYFISTALVECIYHLVYILQDRTLHAWWPDVLDSFRKAYQLLSDFASTWITAKRALQALSSAISPGGGGPGTAQEGLEATPNTNHHGTERAEYSPQDDGLDLGHDPSPDGGFTDPPMWNSSMDFDAAPLCLAEPTMDQLSDQILQEGQRRARLNNADESRFMQSLSSGYGDLVDLDCAKIFSSP